MRWPAVHFARGLRRASVIEDDDSLGRILRAPLTPGADELVPIPRHRAGTPVAAEGVATM
jgi:hypothetical protein